MSILNEYCIYSKYGITPYYHTMRLDFSKLLGNLWYNMYPSILRVHLNKDQ